MQIEICTNSFSSAQIAASCGVDRIELCQALEQGGLSPSLAAIRQSVALKEATNIKVYVLIRPRAGDFCYSTEELEIMREDILFCQSSGVDGVVIGALRPEGQLDISALEVLIRAAGSMGLTFHRAFDYVKEAEQALEQLIELGFERVLSSGQANTAIEGKHFLKKIIQQAGARISIMPGGGVNTQNVETLLRYTGAKEVHFSAKEIIKSPFEKRAGISLNAGDTSDMDYWQTSAERIQAVQEILRQAF